MWKKKMYLDDKKKRCHGEPARYPSLTLVYSKKAFISVGWKSKMQKAPWEGGGGGQERNLPIYEDVYKFTHTHRDN